MGPGRLRRSRSTYFVTLPTALVGPVCDVKGNLDFGSPNFNQHLMARVLSSGRFPAHVESVREGYRVKLAAMLEAADEFLGPLADVRWRRPTGGLYVWVELPERIETGPSGALFDAALREGVLYVPGEYAYPQEGQPVRKNAMRLSFGVQSPEQIRLGMQKLATAIAEVAE